jgi:uncharacterized protein YggE
MKALLATLVAIVCAGTASANITMTGNGKVTYVPNVGYVTVGVSSDGKTAAEAWAKNAKLVNQLFEDLKSMGIDEKEFKTSGLHVSPRYIHPKNAEPQLVGYTVSYDLAITVRKLADLGALLDRLVAHGVNRNVSIGFGIENRDELLDQARVKAIADARHKAELYAKGAGASVGGVLSINEGQVMPFPTYRYETLAQGAASDALRIAAGSQELSVSVTVTWSLSNN